MNFNLAKKLIISFVVSVVVCSTLVVVFTHLNYNSYVKNNNEALLKLINAVYTQGELSTDDIVKILQSDSKLEQNVLEKYSYSVDTTYFLSVSKDKLSQNIIINLTVLVVSIVIIFIILTLVLHKRNKEIQKLIYYLKQLENKNYALQIEESAENELSKLKKEIYNITVLLKEQAENSNIDKLAVKNSIVDISHQLKTPITSISIMLGNIIDFPDMDEITKEKFILSIQENVLHMEFLLKSLLKLSKFDANVINFKSEKIFVKSMINNSINALGSIINEKQIEIITNGDSNSFIWGDIKWQSEAICNIIKNAVEHSYPKSKIEINYYMNNFYSKIAIKDYGKGIASKNLNKIFTRYYKDENSSENSLGVGLNLAKTIVEKGNGTIRVTSNKNNGTVFELTYFAKHSLQNN